MHQPRLSLLVAERLAGLPELAAVAAFGDAGATVAGREGGLTAADPARLGQVLSSGWSTAPCPTSPPAPSRSARRRPPPST